MTNKIAFVSQSGNVAKSVLAQAMALEAVRNRLTVTVADLDEEHRTTVQFVRDREEFGIEPTFNVLSVNTAQEAIEKHTDEQLYIIDCPSRATQATEYIAQRVDLVVMPVTPGRKEINLALGTVAQLQAHGVPLERILIVITRVGTQAELRRAETYINNCDFNGKKVSILSSCIWEKVAYRSALNDGYAITESTFAHLNGNAKAVIHEILTVLIGV